MQTTFSTRVHPLPTGGIDLGPGRRRVTQQDLDLYQALVGGPPQTVEAGVTPEAPTRTGGTADAAPGEAAKWSAALRVAQLRRALVSQLVDCYHGLSGRVGRPDLAAWMYRVSSNAREKISEAHARLNPK